jgi:hypothetical protein
VEDQKITAVLLQKILSKNLCGAFRKGQGEGKIQRVSKRDLQF